MAEPFDGKSDQTPPNGPASTESTANDAVANLAPPLPASVKASFLASEVAHIGLTLLLTVGLFFGLRFITGDIRFALAGGAAALILGRGLTRFFLPEAPSTTAANANQVPPDTFREVIETIVFVVVLVFLLKSFVAEAFVIPTGSMAETLYGYQKDVTCPKCGFEFPVNCSSEVDPQDGQRPLPMTECDCPNCRYFINFVAEQGPGWEPPAWSSGDRVLVAKFLYDLFGKLPDRLDVVVFKYPGNSPQPWPHSGPYKGQTPMNYIKRLVGLPGEVIAIHGGNLYRIAADQIPEEERRLWEIDKVEASARTDPPQLWPLEYAHVKTGEKATEFFKRYRDHLQIIRKPAETLLAMRRIVYDNEHQASDLRDPRWQRWVGDSNWKAEGRDFLAQASEGSATWLRYRHLVPGRDRTLGEPRKSLITDFMGYNTWSRSFSQSGVNWVSDLMLECDVTVQSPHGILTLALARGVDRFQARFDLDAGLCKLVRITDGQETEVDVKPVAMNKPGTYHVRFTDFDERLTVWVDGQLPFGDGQMYTPPAVPGPRADTDLEPASIGLQSGASIRIAKLKLWRDTYYTVADSSPSNPDAGGSVDFADPSTWEPLTRLPIKTMTVQPGHFLCLGDNSPESSDGRAWGLVPERLLLGRAMLVYWPAGRVGRIH